MFVQSLERGKRNRILCITVIRLKTLRNQTGMVHLRNQKLSLEVAEIKLKLLVSQLIAINTFDYHPHVLFSLPHALINLFCLGKTPQHNNDTVCGL